MVCLRDEELFITKVKRQSNEVDIEKLGMNQRR